MECGKCSKAARVASAADAVGASCGCSGSVSSLLWHHFRLLRSKFCVQAPAEKLRAGEQKKAYINQAHHHIAVLAGAGCDWGGTRLLQRSLGWRPTLEGSQASCVTIEGIFSGVFWVTVKVRVHMLEYVIISYIRSNLGYRVCSEQLRFGMSLVRIREKWKKKMPYFFALWRPKVLNASNRPVYSLGHIEKR